MSDIAASPTDLASRPLPASAKSGVVQQIKSFAAQPAVAKSLPLVGFLGLIGLAALLWMTFSAAPGRTLFSGLADSDKAAVVEALETAGISHSLDSSTGALTVPDDKYHQARMLLAGQGLPKSAPDGTSVMEDLPLGASRAVEGERIRSSRQLDLARTIEAIDAVRSARVHIADSGQSAFVRDRAAPAASIMLTLEPGRSLSDGQVQAIVHLAASSVPGLNPEGVSVVDQNGRLLSSAGAASGATGESDRQIAVQQAVEDRYRQSIASLLTPIVGAGNFTAEVHADMDFSQVEASRESYPEASRTLRAEQGTVSSESGTAPGMTAGGIPGALANEPPPAATTTANPDPAAAAAAAAAAAGGVPAAAQETRRNEQYARNYAVGREVSVTRNQTGTVKRLSVAVAIKNPEGGRAFTRDEVQSMENLIRGAVGASQDRGDTVAITARAFAVTEEPEVSWLESAWLSPLVRSGVALLIVLAVVFGLGRPMLKKLGTAAKARSEARADGVGKEIAAALADQNKGDRVTIDMIEAAPSYETRAALIRSFVRQDPARAALVVRDLIRADTAKGA
jgi:flagellar M-ring protein FliF